MNFEKFARNWLPPKLAWRLTYKSRRRRELAEFTAFYRQFLSEGDLCFDVGANLGNRTRSFLHIGSKVIAVEPQSHCLKHLEREFAGESRVILEPVALGRSAGSAELMISSNHVLSSLSDSFVERTCESGRFAKEHWSMRESVEIRTLDDLINQYGVPRFIKIDVEGFESEVLAGLSKPVQALSFEWVPEFPENANSCMHRLMEIGDYEFQLSWGESMRFSRNKWRSLESMLGIVAEFEGENQLFGDIYARLKR